MFKKLSAWSGAIAIRITTEVNALGWLVGDEVSVLVKDGKIIIEKIK